MQKILKREPKGPSGTNTREVSKGYAGGIHPYWFLPSYIKPFDSKKELEDIWKKTAEIFERTEDLVIIGYSFPREDENSRSLFQSSLPKECGITIIDPRWETLKVFLSDLGFSNVKGANQLEQWLKEN